MSAITPLGTASQPFVVRFLNGTVDMIPAYLFFALAPLVCWAVGTVVALYLADVDGEC